MTQNFISKPSIKYRNSLSLHCPGPVFVNLEFGLPSGRLQALSCQQHCPDCHNGPPAVEDESNCCLNNCQWSAPKLESLFYQTCVFITVWELRLQVDHNSGLVCAYTKIANLPKQSNFKFPIGNLKPELRVKQKAQAVIYIYCRA